MQDDLGERRDLGRRLLSLDGGHTDEMGSLSQLFVLREIMNRMGHDLGRTNLRPHEWFDMICGSGTGGLIAILLGRLEMTVEEAIKAYIDLFPDVYSEAKGKRPAEEYKTKQLENGLEKLMSSRLAGGSQERLMSHEQGKCKVFVCTMDSNHLAFPTLFRSYSVRSNRSFDCSVKEAALATTAVPEAYEPVIIGEPIKQPYIAASHGYNNPTELLLREAKDIFQDNSISCIVSIGTGHPGVAQIPSSDSLGQAVIQLSRDCEKVAQDIARQYGQIAGLYFRLNVEQGMQWRFLSGNGASSEVAAHTHSYLANAWTDESINKLIESLRGQKPNIKIKSLSDVASPAKHSRKLCPLPSTNFTGRRQELSQLHQYFSSPGGRHIFVLRGLGGSGKTQTCAKFVEESQLCSPPRFSEVFFVDSTTKKTVETEFIAIAREKNVGDSVDDALNWLAQGLKDWLIVFDNVDDSSVELSYFILPSSFGNILITTRNAALSTFATSGSSIEMGDLEQDDAVQLLLRSSQSEISDVTLGQAAIIVKALHCFALAVAQAGAYIFNCCSLPDYLHLYHEHRDWIHSTHHGKDPERYNRSVYATWSMSVQKLSPVAQQLLHLCSFIHYRGIQKSMFERAVVNICGSNIPDPQNSARTFLQNFMRDGNQWDTTKFHSVVRDLEKYSLLQYDSANNYYNIHPLVHVWCQALEVAIEPVQCVVTILALSIGNEDELEDYIFRKSLVPHIDEVRIHSVSLPDKIATEFYWVYKKAGLWKDCEKLINPVMALRLLELGEEHPDSLESMGNLASTYRDQGRWKEAEELKLAVMEARKRLLGAEHPDTLRSMNNLALSYWNQGRWKEAEELKVAVMEASKRLLGEEHPDTLKSMGNLALSYWNQGRWKEAEELGVAVVEASKRLLGEKHPDTLTSMGNLALSYWNQGRWKEAEELGVAVVEARKRLLGEEHPDTLTSMGNLAATFRNQGRLKEEEELEAAVVEATKRLLGEEHPDTLTSMANLASTYWNQGRLKEAEKLEVAVMEASKRLLGEEHPDTLTSMGNLAATFRNQGRWKEAEELEAAVVEARKRLLGEEHPDTLTSMANLASTFRNQGRLKEAEELDVAVVEARKRLLGEEHPDTLRSMANLASTFRNQGRWKEAEELGVAVMEARKRLLGEEHPDTLTSMGNLASTYWNQGRWKEAEKLEVAVMEARKRLFGEEHPDTLLAMHNLGMTYFDQCRKREAKELLTSAAEKRRRVLGEDHPDTISSIRCLEAFDGRRMRWIESKTSQFKRLSKQLTKAIKSSTSKSRECRKA